MTDLELAAKALWHADAAYCLGFASPTPWKDETPSVKKRWLYIATRVLDALAAGDIVPYREHTGWKNEHCNGVPEEPDETINSGFDCPHCGRDRDPCYDLGTMRARANAGDTVCGQAAAPSTSNDEAGIKPASRPSTLNDE